MIKCDVRIKQNVLCKCLENVDNASKKALINIIKDEDVKVVDTIAYKKPNGVIVFNSVKKVGDDILLNGFFIRNSDNEVFDIVNFNLKDCCYDIVKEVVSRIIADMDE